MLLKNFKEFYQEQVKNELFEHFNYKNIHQVPYLEKIVINMGVGDAVSNSKAMNFAVNDMIAISGQKPSVSAAKISVASFKLKKKTKIGCKVTLRSKRMYDFFMKLVMIVLPRVRDFKGINVRSFDGRGNLTIGLKEQIIFPEIDYDKIDKVRGMDITFVTTASSDAEGKKLLESFGIPFYGNLKNK